METQNNTQIAKHSNNQGKASIASKIHNELSTNELSTDELSTNELSTNEIIVNKTQMNETPTNQTTDQIDIQIDTNKMIPQIQFNEITQLNNELNKTKKQLARTKELLKFMKSDRKTLLLKISKIQIFQNYYTKQLSDMYKNILTLLTDHTTARLNDDLMGVLCGLDDNLSQHINDNMTDILDEMNNTIDIMYNINKIGTINTSNELFESHQVNENQDDENKDCDYENLTDENSTDENSTNENLTNDDICDTNYEYNDVTEPKHTVRMHPSMNRKMKQRISLLRVLHDIVINPTDDAYTNEELLNDIWKNASIKYNNQQKEAQQKEAQQKDIEMYDKYVAHNVTDKIIVSSDTVNNNEVNNNEVANNEVNNNEVNNNDSELTKVLKKYNKRLVVIEEDGEIWYLCSQVCKILGFTIFGSDVVQRQVKYNCKKYFCDFNNKESQGSIPINLNIIAGSDSLFINTNGITPLVLKSRSSNSLEIADILKIKYVPYKDIHAETSAIYCIRIVFANEKMIDQYRVGNYSVDLYFPQYSLIVEIDEKNHVDRNPIKEKERQKYIEESMGAHFIRFNPDDKSFSILNVIKQIYDYIMSHRLRIIIELNTKIDMNRQNTKYKTLN